MTKIDFYVLPADHEQIRHEFVCRLLHKVMARDVNVFIRTESRAYAEQLDTFAWQHKPEWYLPHQLLDPNSTTADTPVGPSIDIGFPDENGGENCGFHHDIIINLAPNVPPYFSSFQRLIEVVNQDSKILEQTRLNFKFYKDRGYPIDTHKL